jgi:hypothetical protein
VGKIIDNGVLLARMILLQQNQLQRTHSHTFRSWLSFYWVPLRTEWSGSHDLLASTLVAGGAAALQVLLSSF